MPRKTCLALWVALLSAGCMEPLACAAPGTKPAFDEKDRARTKVAVTLAPVAKGFEQPTDIQFPPGNGSVFVVLEKEGTAKWVSTADGASGTLLAVKVLTDVEEGLLGLAFHPRFAENGRFFLNYVASVDGRDTTVIDEWRVPAGSDLRKAKPTRTGALLQVRQPYPNHNAGQLAFGPDGYLYVGLGDGGAAGDPHDNGQNMQAMLGKMLRIDVDRRDEGKGYAVPKDNPFVGRAGVLPEIWASGLRNPWRYSFDSKGRLIAADVGQNTWEEIDLLERGGNYGWRLREARHCFRPEKGCPTEGLIDPLYEYHHEEGISITGGYVYEGKRIPALAGKYVFGDYARGKLWAIDLPEKAAPGAPLAKAYALGRWDIAISTFGRDPAGELYVADFASGTIYRLQP